MLPHPNWFEYDFWLFGHKVVSNIDYEFEELADQIELLNRSKWELLTDILMDGKPLEKLEIIFLGPEENMRCFYFLRGIVKGTGEKIETDYVKGSI